MPPRPLVAAVLLAAAAAEASPWHADWRGELYLSAERTSLAADSVLNPDNALARLPEQRHGGEARLDLKLEANGARLTLRPVLALYRKDDGVGTASAHDAYLSRGSLSLPLGTATTLSLGRELLHWGPAQFRSPASPFYFDNGRSDPTRELGGMDAVQWAWTPSLEHGVSLVYVADSGEREAPADPWRRTWLARGEWRADTWAGGLTVAQAAAREPFLGIDLQWTWSDAWLLYGEAASATRAAALLAPAAANRPFTLVPESARRATLLLGATRTLSNGQSVTLEVLHDGHGCDAAQTDAYFARAAADAGAAALALGHAPALLGRDYVHLIWQSNPLDDGTYWRLMGTRNLSDAGDEVAAYLEHPLDGRWSLYAQGLVHGGGPRREFGALLEDRITIGARVALP